ncbi:MAG TPA: hypothetical protein VKH81_17240 [Candidatus Angelobacter sp.]|nr:hypothetical protein [Candidatus Angelobacter sp.]
MTTVPMRRQSGVGCLTRLVLTLVIVGVVMAGATYLFSPWAYYMGGRFHWFPSWQGVGRLHSNSGGGDYAVYVYFYPRLRRYSGLRHVAGNAVLCTPRGERFTLTLGGDFGKADGRDLNGKSARFYMFNRTAAHILSGGSARPELKLRGRWNNPDLVLDDDSSIQRNFDHNANLYPDGKNRPYLGEVSTVTLREGSKSDFEAACAAIKSR